MKKSDSLPCWGDRNLGRGQASLAAGQVDVENSLGLVLNNSTIKITSTTKIIKAIYRLSLLSLYKYIYIYI